MAICFPSSHTPAMRTAARFLEDPIPPRLCQVPRDTYTINILLGKYVPTNQPSCSIIVGRERRVGQKSIVREAGLTWLSACLLTTRSYATSLSLQSVKRFSLSLFFFPYTSPHYYYPGKSGEIL